jgi:hypothetical protein
MHKLSPLPAYSPEKQVPDHSRGTWVNSTVNSGKKIREKPLFTSYTVTLKGTVSQDE